LKDKITRNGSPEGKKPAKAKKVSTQMERKRLVEELDGLASQLCRLQWHMRCGMCGKDGTQTHHFFTKRAHGSTRWNDDGLCWLCFGCHIYKVHGKGDTETIRDAIINRIGQERFDALKREAQTIRKYTMDDLRAIKARLIKDRQDLICRQAEELF
jgi:5-methylcytosine-specific restriction endonuclease McrA